MKWSFVVLTIPMAHAISIQSALYSDEQTMHNTVGAMVGKWDANHDGRLSRDEFTSNVLAGLGTDEGNMNDTNTTTHMPWFKRLWQAIGAVGSQRKQREREGEYLLSLVGDTNATKFISLLSAREFFERGLHHEFPALQPTIASGDPCQQATQAVADKCKTPREIQLVRRYGQQMTLMTEYCSRGLSVLSGYFMENCLIAADSCINLASCFDGGAKPAFNARISNEYSSDQEDLPKVVSLSKPVWHPKIYGMDYVNARLGAKILTWSLVDTIYERHADTYNSRSATACKETFDRMLMFTFNSALDPDTSNGPRMSTNIIDTLKDYEACLIRGDQKNVDGSYEQCLMSKLAATTATSWPYNATDHAVVEKAYCEDCQSLRKHNLSAMNMPQFQKRFMPVVYVLGIIGPLIGIVAAVLLSSVSVPIIIPGYISTNAGIKSASNNATASNTWILLPIISNAPGAGVQCISTQLSWGSCGLVESPAAQSCPQGSSLRYPGSCSSYWNFNQGSLICNKKALSLAHTPTDAPKIANATLGAKVRNVLMGPFKYQCQSLCVKYLPEGCTPNVSTKPAAAAPVDSSPDRIIRTK